jgi:Transposase IS116/IS110/IS902 family
VPTKKSAAQYRVMLAAVRPRDQLGRTRRRSAAEQLADLVQIDARIKTLKAELTQAVPARGSQLMTIHGIGPAAAARILADVGDVARFPDRNHVASWTGTAPIDASSGEQIRHRLSRAPGTGESTTCSTWPRSGNCATTLPDARTLSRHRGAAVSCTTAASRRPAGSRGGRFTVTWLLGRLPGTLARG